MEAVFRDEHQISRKRSPIGEFALWTAATALLFVSLGGRQLWKSEGRWAEVTREMFLTRDFFHPTLNGSPYFDKPLLGYWLIAGIAQVTGKLDEWAVRLPSALAGLAGLGATVWLGRRLWSRAVGLTAGWILLTTYGFLFFGRLGIADMENLAAIMLAVAWYWARRERPGFSSYLGFYLICFVGAMTKGLAAVAVPVLAILPDLVRGGRWRRQVNVAHVVAIVLGAAIYFAPFMYANVRAGGYKVSGLDLVVRENLQRFVDPFDHSEPWYVYFYYLPILFLPWTPLLVAAVVNVARRYRQLDEQTRWLLEAALLIFLFFTASGSRRSYYILPVVPLCALLTAVSISNAFNERAIDSMLRIVKVAGMIACLAALLSPAIWPLVSSHMPFGVSRELLWATSLIGLVGLVPLILEKLRGSIIYDALGVDRRMAATGLCMAALLAGFFCVQFESLDALTDRKAFAGRVKKLASTLGLNVSHIGFARVIPPSILFYLDYGTPLVRVGGWDGLRQFLEQSRENKILIASGQSVRWLRSLGMPADALGPAAVVERGGPWQSDDSDYLMAYVVGFDRFVGVEAGVR